MLIAASLCFCLLGIFLVCGALPPNRRFGLITQRSLSDDAIWYRAHREFGSIFCWVGVLIGAISTSPDIHVHPAAGITGSLVVAAAFVAVFRRYAA